MIQQEPEKKDMQLVKLYEENGVYNVYLETGSRVRRGGHDGRRYVEAVLSASVEGFPRQPKA